MEAGAENAEKVKKKFPKMSNLSVASGYTRALSGVSKSLLYAVILNKAKGFAK